MVSNQGKITTLDTNANVNKGLVDGTDKLHSGIIKVLESFAQGDMIYRHGGFTITNDGTFTQYNLVSAIKFISRGQYSSYSGANLSVAYTSSPVQSPTDSRYDWVLLNPNIGGTPSLVIVQGTAASTPLVSDITAGYIPVALVHISSGTDDDKSDYSFQTYTMNVAKNSLSIGRDDSGYTESLSIVSSNAGDANDGNVIIKNLEQDADIIFNVNDGGSDSQALRIFGATKQVYVTGALTLGANSGFSISESSDDVTIRNIITDKDLIFTVNDGGSTVEVMRIDGSEAKVGIGTSTPSEKLEVQGDVKHGNLEMTGGTINLPNSQDCIISVGATTGTTAGRDLTVQAGSTSKGSNNIDGGDLILKSGGGDGTGTSIIAFHSKVDGTDDAAERMRIDTLGNLTIGSQTPSTTRLGVNGAVGASAYHGSVVEFDGDGLAGNNLLALSASTHRTVITRSTTSAPNPPNEVQIQCPVSTTIVGWECRIICMENAGGPDNTFIFTQGSDELIDATGAVIATSSGTTYSLTTGTAYQLICLDNNRFMLYQLN